MLNKIDFTHVKRKL